MQMKHYFVLGDININTNTTNLNSLNFINMLSTNCSTSIIDIPTRVTCTSSTVFDHIITNENRHVIRPVVVDHSITDHFPIMAIIERKFVTKNTSQKFVRSFRNFDPVKYNNDLQSQFNQFLPQLYTETENDFNNKFDKFYSIIKLTIENHAPLKKLSRKQQRLENKPWIIKSLLISIKKKQKMHKTHYIFGLPSEKKYYKLYSNTLTRVKNLAKRLYYHNKITEHKNNPKKTWDVLRSLLPSKTKSKSINSLAVKNSTITDINGIAEEFNYHFATIGKSLASTINNKDKSPTFS